MGIVVPHYVGLRLEEDQSLPHHPLGVPRGNAVVPDDVLDKQVEHLGVDQLTGVFDGFGRLVGGDGHVHLQRAVSDLARAPDARL
ncbi:hypothetical protein [Actinomadura rubrisoli]|uniref:Uncharacterized protein n=1 Tax=Actinomadura rubrisoli TaxID=2530368 RepID=A0A4R5B4L2_9ACTN|nr:hypothetical protein [Actinomadura rubrisoli]TDD79913.1 hypothetical protein E1298_26850 [Actinomadura rubrisoli]